MTHEEFNRIVKATGKNFTTEQSIDGEYYRLLCDDEIIIGDSACEDLYGTEEEAMDFFAEVLLSDYVPEDKKVLVGGCIWRLKD